MDKQFQRLVELEKKKDAGTITKSEQTRMDKLIMRYIRKMEKESLKYQSLLLEQNKTIVTQTNLLTAQDDIMKQCHLFLKEKGLLEEYKVFAQQNKIS
ncbi:hypothetical protein HPT25_28130 [Bacillus sp. BRMEA1]|nr:hypothetical protein [Neobacillus endophyticus]